MEEKCVSAQTPDLHGSVDLHGNVTLHQALMTPARDVRPAEKKGLAAVI